VLEAVVPASAGCDVRFTTVVIGDYCRPRPDRKRANQGLTPLSPIVGNGFTVAVRRVWLPDATGSSDHPAGALRPAP
jgi:hypothetical protein